MTTPYGRLTSCCQSMLKCLPILCYIDKMTASYSRLTFFITVCQNAYLSNVMLTKVWRHMTDWSLSWQYIKMLTYLMPCWQNDNTIWQTDILLPKYVKMFTYIMPHWQNDSVIWQTDIFSSQCVKMLTYLMSCWQNYGNMWQADFLLSQ
jgi:hypothetical protein